MYKEWFRNWFNSKYYHILYQHRDEKEAKKLIENLMGFMDLPKNGKIIDIACGKGRHSLYLSKLNYQVTGIDLAESSIEHARNFENENLKFFCHDKRQIFRKGYFDCGLNLFTSFGYLDTKEDLELAFESMTSNIKANGLFVMDFLNSHAIRKQNQEDETIEVSGIVFRIKKKINRI